MVKSSKSTRSARKTTPKKAQKARSRSKTHRLIRPGTKQARLVALLSRPKGANLSELEKATGWQPHTVRAALTGLRKKGYEITREKSEKGLSRYRAAPPATAPAPRVGG